jgi:hypothetical protein
MNIPHTPIPWILQVQGEPNQYVILTPDRKNWVLGLIHNGEPLESTQQANLRFLLRAVNNHYDLLETVRILACDLRVHLESDRDRQGVLISQVCPCYEELLKAERLVSRVDASNKVDPDQCCDRDYDHDGNCDQHPVARP